MDYSKMTDFEINMKVAELCLDYDSISRLPHEGMSVHWGDGANWHTYNPCNNAADAWSIIIENRIAITPDSTAGEWVAFNNFTLYEGDWMFASDPTWHANGTNPLRAAMIVYLQLQEAK